MNAARSLLRSFTSFAPALTRLPRCAGARPGLAAAGLAAQPSKARGAGPERAAAQSDPEYVRVLAAHKDEIHAMLHQQAGAPNRMKIKLCGYTFYVRLNTSSRRPALCIMVATATAPNAPRGLLSCSSGSWVQEAVLIECLRRFCSYLATQPATAERKLVSAETGEALYDICQLVKADEGFDEGGGGAAAEDEDAIVNEEIDLTDDFFNEEQAAGAAPPANAGAAAAGAAQMARTEAVQPGPEASVGVPPVVSAPPPPSAAAAPTAAALKRKALVDASHEAEVARKRRDEQLFQAYDARVAEQEAADAANDAAQAQKAHAAAQARQADAQAAATEAAAAAARQAVADVERAITDARQ